MHALADMVTYVLVRWGYLALACGLLGECAGLPLPGETTLLLASFVAHKTHQLNIFLVILIGTAAAVAGDNVGFWIGRRFGPRFLRWLKRKFSMDDDIATATKLIRRHGAATIFWARYIVGLRTVAGPVAGALNMEWEKFLLYNVLGGASRVCTIALIGYVFAVQFRSLAGYIEKASWGIAAVVFGVGYILWRRKKKSLKAAGRV